MSTEDIDENIRLLRSIIEASPANRASLQSDLAIQLGDRYSRTHVVADNREAIRLAHEAVQATPEDDPYRAIVLHTLSIQLGDQFERTNEIHDSDEAIQVARASVNAALEKGQDYIQMAYDLGVQLSEMCDRRGELAELQQSISSTPDGGSDWLRNLNGLAVRLNK